MRFVEEYGRVPVVMAPYDEFKRLRNKLRKFYPEHVINRCVNRLRQNERDRDLGFAPPWTFMLLIKWTLMHGDFISPDRRELTDRNWNDLLVICDDLQRSVEMQDDRRDECDWFLYFRKLAYQQFLSICERRFLFFSVPWNRIYNFPPFLYGFVLKP